MANNRPRKVLFQRGDVTRVRHPISNRPEMVVKKVKFSPIPKKEIEELGLDPDAKRLIGVICFWFDKNEVYNEQIFSSKDLEEPISLD